jgi:hypothetical protein
LSSIIHETTKINVFTNNDNLLQERNESTLHMLHIKWLWRFSMIKLFKKNKNDQSESLLNIMTIGVSVKGYGV